MTLPDGPHDPSWITGIGAATPPGCDFDTIADSLLAGRSCVKPVTDFPSADHPSRIAAQVGPIPCPPGLDPDDFALLSPMDRAVRWCCHAALRDSGLFDLRHDLRIGLVLGLGAEWLVRWEGDALVTGSISDEGRWRGAESIVNAVGRELGLTGPILQLSAACASGNHALAAARRWLRRGWADVVLAGAFEMAVTPMALASFGNLRALSRRNDTPSAASRPFDRARDGFVIGDGGAVFVVEPSSRARARGARAFAEVSGFGATSDAYHPVIPSPDPQHAVSAMHRALSDARVSPSSLHYINAHATGTPVGDAIEASALRTLLGPSVVDVPVSSTKGMTGHLLTAAGAMECLACLVAIDRSALPPTINLDDPDPECDLRHVRNHAEPASVSVAVSNSFGFGGSNTCLVLKAV